VAVERKLQQEGQHGRKHKDVCFKMQQISYRSIIKLGLIFLWQKIDEGEVGYESSENTDTELMFDTGEAMKGSKTSGDTEKPLTRLASN